MMEMDCVGQKAHSKVIKTSHGKSNIPWHAELLNISEQYLFKKAFTILAYSLLIIRAWQRHLLKGQHYNLATLTYPRQRRVDWWRWQQWDRCMAPTLESFKPEKQTLLLMEPPPGSSTIANLSHTYSKIENLLSHEDLSIKLWWKVMNNYIQIYENFFYIQ